MKINARELEGAELDWAVGIALNGHTIMTEIWGVNILGRSIRREVEEGRMHPSTDWHQGGPLIEHHLIQLHTYTGEQHGEHERWYAVVPTSASGSRAAMGPTPLVAAMRALVFAKLGEWVEIPDELAG